MALDGERKPLVRRKSLRRSNKLRRVPLARGRTDEAESPTAPEPDGSGVVVSLPPTGSAQAPRRSSSGRAAPLPAALRKLVIARAEHCCDRCGRYLVGQPYSLQHRRARGAGGRRGSYLDTAANLVLLCGHATTPGGCHWLVEFKERALGVREGFVIPGEVIDPASHPILRHGRDWVIPSADGWISADPIAS